MPKIYSYVVEHDDGFAPNPQGRLCTLARCKFSRSNRPNIVELAQEGDWIIGTGGANLRKSAGHGKLIYAMRVTEKISLEEYFERYGGKRFDTENPCATANRFALLSSDFRYFGESAIAIPNYLRGVEKKSQGFKSIFPAEFIQKVVNWLQTLPRGKHGQPCQSDSERMEFLGIDCNRQPRCKRQMARKKVRVC